MRIGILGATGAVGEQMLKVMEERGIDCELRLFASQRSLGRTASYMGRDVELRVISDEGLRGLDYLLGAAEADVSRALLPQIRDSGAVYIDNSSAFRLDPEVPLVIPQINGGDALNHKGVVANPNCSTIITYMALAPIRTVYTRSSVHSRDGSGRGLPVHRAPGPHAPSPTAAVRTARSSSCGAAGP